MTDPMKCWFKRSTPVPTTTYEEGILLGFQSLGETMGDYSRGGVTAIVSAKTDGVLTAVPLAQVSIAAENPDATAAKAKAKADQDAAADLKKQAQPVGAK
jgi:hypothetical protein